MKVHSNLQEIQRRELSNQHVVIDKLQLLKHPLIFLETLLHHID